jgi:hypothetical protein
MKKILFALNQNYDNEIEEKVKEKYIELTGNTFEYKSEYYLSGIWKKLEEEEFDILILKEDLEGDSIKTQYLDNMTDQFPNLRIIFIANDEHERDSYIRKLFNLVIYDILFKEDLTLGNLSELIEEPRNKINAKIYLDIDSVETVKEEDNMSIIPDEELDKIVINLKESENISEVFDKVRAEYDEKKMLFLMSILPESIKEKLSKSGNEYYETLHKRWLLVDNNFVINDQADKKEKKRSSKETKTKIETEYIQRLPSDYNKVIAVTGCRQVGTTTIVDLMAKFFAKHDKRVSVLDLTSKDTLLYMKTWGNEEIKPSQKNSLIYLNQGENNPILINEKYKLYTRENKDIDFKFDFFNSIEQLRYNSDIIIIDMDFNTPNEWLKYNVSSLYIVTDLNIFNTIETKDYIKKLMKSGINPKKINMIVNKVVKAKIKPDDIITSIKQPLPYLEVDIESNTIDINREFFTLDFDKDIYSELLSSYMYVGEDINVTENMEEQLSNLCNNIYPVSTGKNNNIKKKLKKLVPFIK